MSVQCNGSGQYIRATGLTMPLNAPYTFAFWMKHNTSTAAFSTAGILHATTTLNSGDRLKLDDTSGNDTTINGDFNATTVALKAPTLGVWEYVAVCGTGGQFGNDAQSRYMTDAQMTDAGGVTATITSTSNITIGADADTTLPYKGSFAHVRVWIGVKLTGEQLRQESLSATPVNTANLYLSWPLANATDTTDQSGNGHTPTINGAVTTDSSPWMPPTGGTLALTGYAPTVSVQSAPPGTGVLALTGFAPVLLLNTIIAPGAGTLTLSGNAPVLPQSYTIQPAAGALTLTGYVPVQTLTTPAPGTGSLILTGYTPAVTQQAYITPGVGSLVLAGYAPSALVTQLITPPAGALTINGMTPSVLAQFSIQPPAGALTLTTQAPLVGVSYTDTVPNATLSLTGYAPLLSSTGLIIPPAGSLTLASAPPNFSYTVGSIGPGALALTGYAPSLFVGSVPGVYPGPTIMQFLPSTSLNQVSESSNYALQLTFYDVYGQAFTPATVSWRLWDDTNKVLLQDWTALQPAPSIFVNITANLNVLASRAVLSEVRLAIVKVVTSAGAIRYDESAYTVNSIADLP